MSVVANPTLADDLLDRGYENITILDISQTAIDANRKRLGKASERVRWLVADITKAELERSAYDVWHDRAVFHFLTAASDRIAYMRQIAGAVRPGGHVIVSTFGPEGPAKCSGLDVVRYDAESLHSEFGTHFRLLSSSKELHQTPARDHPAVFVLLLQDRVVQVSEPHLCFGRMAAHQIVPEQRPLFPNPCKGRVADHPGVITVSRRNAGSAR
jgi:SAM-dependent methyltransferase